MAFDKIEFIMLGEPVSGCAHHDSPFFNFECTQVKYAYIKNGISVSTCPFALLNNGDLPTYYYLRQGLTFVLYFSNQTNIGSKLQYQCV